MDLTAALTSVLEAPDDDARRLVYADALLEAGDPLGEFLRLECSPRGKDDRRARQRAQDLLIMNWKRWLGPLANLVQRRASRFDRGFLQSAALAFPRQPALTAAQFAEIAACPLWQLVESIEIFEPGSAGTRPAEIGTVLASPHLTRLESLTGSVPELEAIPRSPAFRLRHLVVREGPGPLTRADGWRSLTSLQLRLETSSRDWLQSTAPRSREHQALIARLKRELRALVDPALLATVATVTFAGTEERWPGEALSRWALEP
jgi:uncharacterized protein (TIGR02996 family)